MRKASSESSSAGLLAAQIDIREQGRAGVITLTRPGALNAITFQMFCAIAAALERWRDDPNVALVIIEGQGDRAFSAGGDVGEIYRAGLDGDVAFSRRLWRTEYPFLASIADYPKPYVALMDGYVMGLGAGVSMHASHRVTTEATLFAMPECAIGHLPDTGVSAPFAKAPPGIGLYLGMTGARIGAADMIHAGLADVFVPRERLLALRQALVETGDPESLQTFRAQPPDGELPRLHTSLQKYFTTGTALEIVQSLEAAGGDVWAERAAAAIRAASPLSVACFHRVLSRVAENPTVQHAVAWEFRYAYRSLSDGDFMEGVRAQIIDKDRHPSWSVPQLEALRDEKVDAMLAELGRDELYSPLG